MDFERLRRLLTDLVNWGILELASKPGEWRRAGGGMLRLGRREGPKKEHWEGLAQLRTGVRQLGYPGTVAPLNKAS